MGTLENGSVKSRTSAYAKTLERLFDFTVKSGEYNSFHCEDVTLTVLPLDGPAGNRPHLVRLGRGLIAPQEVQDVPFGVVEESGLAAVGETDERGQTRVSLGPGTYRFRFVLEIASRLDAEIILRLGDEAFLPMLQDALEDRRTPSSLRTAITNLDSSSQPTISPAGSQRWDNVWAAEVQPSLAADATEEFPVAVRLKWESPDASRVAVLDRPRFKGASSHTLLYIVFYDQPSGAARQRATDFCPAGVTLSGKSAESIESGQASFVWEQLHGEPELIVDGSKWSLVQQDLPGDDLPSPRSTAQPLRKCTVLSLVGLADSPHEMSLGERLRANQNKPAWVDRGRFHFAYPADQASFPYGVALIQWVNAENVCVDTKLLPVHLRDEADDNCHYYYNVVPLHEVLDASIDPSNVQAVFYEDLDMIASAATPKQVEAWIDQYGDLWEADWRQRIENLRSRLKGNTESRK